MTIAQDYFITVEAAAAEVGLMEDIIGWTGTALAGLEAWLETPGHIRDELDSGASSLDLPDTLVTLLGYVPNVGSALRTMAKIVDASAEEIKEQADRMDDLDKAWAPYRDAVDVAEAGQKVVSSLFLPVVTLTDARVSESDFIKSALSRSDFLDDSRLAGKMTDYILVYEGWAHDDMKGRDGNDLLTGGGGNDTINGGGSNDTLLGGGKDDVMDGGNGRDSFDGENGNDILSGGRDADILIGGAGYDALDGGDGTDTLAGNRGNDTLTGGAGWDQFFFDGGDDVLTDFKDNKDTILFVFWNDLTVDAADILDMANIVGSDAVFEIDGHTLTVLGVNDLGILENDVASL